MQFKAVKQLASRQALAATLVTSIITTGHCSKIPKSAMIYRGKTACDGCPESIGELLKGVYPNIKVTYAGPDEITQINSDTLSNVDVFAQGGGPDLGNAWKEAKQYAPAVRDFVANGGNYMSFCLGAFLAGPDSGFGLLSKGDDVVREIKQPDAQIDDGRNAVIEVDWRFSTGPERGKTVDNRWLFFQDGAAFLLAPDTTATVLANYSSNGDVAATLNPYGKGWVANVGPHPEADQSWYDDAGISNPEGFRTDIGYDFIQALIEKAG